jgi:hypothetical protein
MAATPSNTFVSPPHSVTVQGAYEPFELQVARNQIMGHYALFKFGINGDVGTSVETVWAQGGTYVYPTAATVMKISSSSADDAAAGTGARTISIAGLDASYNEISETVTLNGQTEVNTVNSYLRITRMFVVTAGSGATAVGVIYAGTGTVTSGVPATVYGMIAIGANQTQMAFWTVPAGYTLYLMGTFYSSGNSTANAFTNFQLIQRPLGGVFRQQSSTRTPGSGDFVLDLHTPVAFPEKTDIEIRAIASAGSSNVSAEFEGIYIKNDSQAA